LPRAALLVGVVFVLFALPVFRTPAVPAEVMTAEQLETQTTIDTAQRQAAAADRALDRAWMLARVAAAWAPLSPARAEAGLDAALAAEAEAQANADALWGAAQAAREAAIGAAADLAEAELIAAELEAVRGRSWALRLIAAEWQAVDPARAEAIRELALAQTLARPAGPIRDLDLRALAADWAWHDTDRGLNVAARIEDPAMRAWALRAVAAAGGNGATYLAAAVAARTITAPVQRARVLAAVAAASGNAQLYAEAIAALATAGNSDEAFGLSDLAARYGDARFATPISDAYPAAQAFAWLGVGDFARAWDAAGRISDPLQRDRALAAIAGAWGDAEAAQQIGHPLFRAAALRDVTAKTGNPSLTNSIEIPYYRLSALTALGQFTAAAALAGELSDPYPLVNAIQASAAGDPAAALALVDSLDREADKASALRVLAAETGDPAIFERALSLALAARVRGDALAPAEASLALAQAVMPAHPDWAERALAQSEAVAKAIAIK
jgi:hypothetical protein